MGRNGGFADLSRPSVDSCEAKWRKAIDPGDSKGAQGCHFMKVREVVSVNTEACEPITLDVGELFSPLEMDIALVLHSR